MPRLIAVPLFALVLAACGSNDDLSAFIDAPSSQHDAPAADSRPLDAFQFLDAPADPTGISTAINTPDGPANVAINGVTVTYLKPLVAAPDDPAGFTIQANQQGPGLFMTVDPTTTTPTLAVGDVVSFTITNMTTLDNERRATAITSLTRSATATDVSTLARDVSSATDLLNNLAAYDSTIVDMTGTFSGTFAASGTGFQSSEIDTAGITGQAALTFRTAAALVDTLDMEAGCAVTATNVPVDRFKSTFELGAYVQGDFTINSCPAPVIVNAVVTDDATVVVNFSRLIDPSTVTAGLFTGNNNLSIKTAVVTSRSITLTTSAQTAGTMYTITVADGIKDMRGTALGGTPPTASFLGFTVPAKVVINELNANVKSGCDLIELRVTQDGAMGGFRITERTGSAGGADDLDFTFPQGFNVTKNAIVMVHESSASTTCNPKGATQELMTPTDQGSASFTGNYDTAFDFWAPDAGLVASTDNTLTLYDSTGAIADAVFLEGSGSGAAATLAQAGVIGTANQWVPAQTTYASADFIAAAVPGLGTTGTAVTGTATSIQRGSDTDTNAKADWVTAAQTFGSINAGQATLPAKALRRRSR